MQGAGCRVQGAGFRVEGLGSRCDDTASYVLTQATCKDIQMHSASVVPSPPPPNPLPPETTHVRNIPIRNPHVV